MNLSFLRGRREPQLQVDGAGAAMLDALPLVGGGAQAPRLEPFEERRAADHDPYARGGRRDADLAWSAEEPAWRCGGDDTPVNAPRQRWWSRLLRWRRPAAPDAVLPATPLPDAMAGAASPFDVQAKPRRRSPLAGLAARVAAVRERLVPARATEEEAEPSPLQRRWRELAARFDARNRRERVMIAVGALAVMVGLGDALWLTPALRTHNQARAALSKAQTDRTAALAEFQGALATMQQQQAAHRRELDSWRQRVQESDEALRRQEAALVSPDRIVRLLEQVMAGHARVKVTGLRSLGHTDVLSPAQPRTQMGATAEEVGQLVRDTVERGVDAVGQQARWALGLPVAGAGSPPPAPASPAPQLSLYRHGLELQLEGSYPDLLAYVRSLEALPQHLLWGSSSIDVVDHPKTRLTLRLYTLSREPHWLAL